MFWKTVFEKKKKKEEFNAFKAHTMTVATLVDKERQAWDTWEEEIEKEVIEATSKGEFECNIKIKMKKGVETNAIYDVFNPLIRYLEKRGFEVLTEYSENTNELNIRLFW